MSTIVIGVRNCGVHSLAGVSSKSHIHLGFKSGFIASVLRDLVAENSQEIQVKCAQRSGWRRRPQFCSRSSALTAPVLRADVVRAFTAGRLEDASLIEGRS